MHAKICGGLVSTNGDLPVSNRMREFRKTRAHLNAIAFSKSERKRYTHRHTSEDERCSDLLIQKRASVVPFCEIGR